jgi:hypothetical protein
MTRWDASNRLFAVGCIEPPGKRFSPPLLCINRSLAVPRLACSWLHSSFTNQIPLLFAISGPKERDVHGIAPGVPQMARSIQVTGFHPRTHCGALQPNSRDFSLFANSKPSELISALRATKPRGKSQIVPTRMVLANLDYSFCRSLASTLFFIPHLRYTFLRLHISMISSPFLNPRFLFLPFPRANRRSGAKAYLARGHPR